MREILVSIDTRAFGPQSEVIPLLDRVKATKSCCPLAKMLTAVRSLLGSINLANAVE
jgi:hypothetical protein